MLRKRGEAGAEGPGGRPRVPGMGTRGTRYGSGGARDRLGRPGVSETGRDREDW